VTVQIVRDWVERINTRGPDGLINCRARMCDALARAKYVAKAHQHCISLRSKQVSPHVLRHSAAMELLQTGVDCSVIALWLGREAMETTLTYLHTHLELKESALAKLKPYKRAKAERFRPKTGFWNS